MVLVSGMVVLVVLDGWVVGSGDGQLAWVVIGGGWQGGGVWCGGQGVVVEEAVVVGGVVVVCGVVVVGGVLWVGGWW